MKTNTLSKKIVTGMLAFTMIAGSAALPMGETGVNLFEGFNISADAANSVPSKTVKSEKEIVDFIKTQLKNHTETFKITLKNGEMNCSRMHALINASFVNTSEPMGGDFAYIHATQKKYWVVSSTDNKNFTIKMTYTISQSQFAAVNKEMNRIINSLKLSGKTQRQKADAIYNYVCQNTKYYNNGGSCYYAYSAFVEKKAVCQGMALELYALMKKAGIDCRIVDGYSDGVSHAWNKIKLGSSWYYIDAAYDCGRNPAYYNSYLKTSLSQMPGNRYEDKSMENPATYKNYNVSSREFKSNISKASVSSIPDYTYDGTAKKPFVIVKYGTKTLVNGTDYTVSYSNNVNAGWATVTIKGKGNYTGSVQKRFQIKQFSINNSKITLSQNKYTYDGTAKKPSVIVKYGTKTLVNGTDYTISYSNNVNAGWATVTIKGKGKYTGSVQQQFQIKAIDIKNAKITLSQKKYYYDGLQKKPTVTVNLGGKTLKSGADYTVSYQNNVNIGSAYVIIVGRGNYINFEYCFYQIVKSPTNISK